MTRIKQQHPHPADVAPPGISILPFVLELISCPVTRHMLPYGKLSRPIFARACVVKRQQRAKGTCGLTHFDFPGDGLLLAGYVSSFTAQAALTTSSAFDDKREGSYVVPSRKM